MRIYGVQICPILTFGDNLEQVALGLNGNLC
jgi:hypothetical protein